MRHARVLASIAFYFLLLGGATTGGFVFDGPDSPTRQVLQIHDVDTVVTVQAVGDITDCSETDMKNETTARMCEELREYIRQANKP